MNSITQDMKYRQSLLTYAQKYGVSRASRKYNKSRSYIYFWRARYDGSLQSLACRSRRPHSHPNQHSGATSSRIAQFIIIDTLFTGVAGRNLPHYRMLLNESYKHSRIKKVPGK